MSSSDALKALISSDEPGVRGRREAALSLLKRGTDRNQVIARTGFTSEELFAIEQAYYEARGELSPRAMRIKQIDRLDALVDLAYDQIETFGLADSKGNWGQNLQALLAVLKEISEVANIKRQTITHEVRVIEEKQVNVMFSYVNQVLEEFVALMLPHLAPKARRALEENRASWFDTAVTKPARLLEATIDMEED